MSLFNIIYKAFKLNSVYKKGIRIFYYSDRKSVV